MTDDTDLTDSLNALSDSGWRERLAQIGAERGAYERLGDRHSAFLIDQGPVLVVTFETLRDIRAGRADQMPYGLAIADEEDWSHLCIIAEGDTWWRDPAVIAYFDRLVDEAFFERFERVVFYGAGAGGYAAAAYSVTAPGAVVILVHPRATLDPAVTGWDPRDAHLRRLNFRDRYAYAPEMIDGAGQVFVLYDPHETLDAMQAALFTRRHVARLACRGGGADLARLLCDLRITPRLILAAGEGRLTPALVWRLWRARRDSAPWLAGLVDRLDRAGRLWLAAIACEAALDRSDSPALHDRLVALEPRLAAAGLLAPEEEPTA